MKRILYLSFYFEPDLCAGSFRNTPLAIEMARQLGNEGIVDVITTVPNRYSTFNISATASEHRRNLIIHRIQTPKHHSGFLDQINSFRAYFSGVKKIIEKEKYDLVFASSSRLFTAYLGYTVAKKRNIPLYLDIRDIFRDTLQDVLPGGFAKLCILPILKIIENKVFNYATHINLISGGFQSYFKKYKRPNYSAFSNGIDPEFLQLKPSVSHNGNVRLITYAGNIGEGQGLHKIIPQAAKKLGKNYRFLIIGDGGARQKLVDKINLLDVTNVDIKNPVTRKELLKLYQQSDYLFLHLNDYDAFKKVLPSKIFELGAYDKPVIAGVAGFANQFISKHISNSILFLPANVEDMVNQLKVYNYRTGFRKEFLEKFTRDHINDEMSKNVLFYLT